jgi:glutathione S-transferase
MTLRLHDYSASANCYKVRLLLAQLERPYERVPVDIFGGETLTDDFARLTPARMTPVLEPDDGEPLSESNAILLHLAEGTEFLPEDPGKRAQVYRWLFYEQSEIIPGIAGLRFRLITGRIPPDGPQVEARRATGAAALGVLNERLTPNEFLAGDLGEYPAVREWIGRVEGTRGFMNDLEPYPPNAWPGKSRSIYD